jgi:RNA polymerase sigma factor (sigma-70 family)
MNPSPCPSADDQKARQYLAMVVRTVQHLAAKRYGIEAADELVQRVAEQFWVRRGELMANYAPEAFAAVALRSRAEELRRSERIQRGEGARLQEQADGLKKAGREVIQLEPYLESGGPLPHAQHDVAARATDVVLVRNALQQLTPRDRSLVLLVDGHGWTVSEAAAEVGLSRPYANRELTRIRGFLREAVRAA